MPKTVILGTARTPIGKLGGGLSSLDATELGATAIECALERASVEPEQVDHVVMGQVLQAGQGQIPSRQAQMKAGIPKEVSSETINKVCASGVRAAGILDAAIRAGDVDIAVAGGMESMSQAPYLLPKARFGMRLGNGEILDATVVDGLWCATEGVHMGTHAERVAGKSGITREDQDRFALESHRRAVAARDVGRFIDEIVPIEIPRRKGDPVVVDADEPPRPDTTLEQLGKLRAAFVPEGSVTAGNSSGINDGASALLLASEEALTAAGWQAMARIVTTAVAGVEPRMMGVGPVFATRKALGRAGLSIDDIDLVELNEAFAAQSLACIDELGLDRERVNVNGGAIALGHPLGCSGARILTSLVHEMVRRDARYGLATMCIGVGQGIATIVERV